LAAHFRKIFSDRAEREKKTTFYIELTRKKSRKKSTELPSKMKDIGKVI